MRKNSYHLVIGTISGLFGGKKSLTKQIQTYMKFYYPSTGPTTYHISFDWGVYTISTGAKPDADVHDDSKPYRGYITFRPKVTKHDTNVQPSIYLITAAGEVWENTAGDDIPAINVREEIRETKSEGGTLTSTTIIKSESEPLIDHFKAHPEQWRQYGTLKAGGRMAKLKLAKR